MGRSAAVRRASWDYDLTERTLLNPPGLERTVLLLGWFALVAAAIGLVAFALARTGAPAAERSVARFGAGLVAVIAAGWVLIGGFNGFDRPVDAFAGDLVVLGVAAVLIWLAVTARASAYLYPAGVGVLIALSDLNGTYVADWIGTGPALFVEGIALLVTAFAVDRLRRRLGAPGGSSPIGRVAPVA